MLRTVACQFFSAHGSSLSFRVTQPSPGLPPLKLSWTFSPGRRKGGSLDSPKITPLTREPFLPEGRGHANRAEGRFPAGAKTAPFRRETGLNGALLVAMASSASVRTFRSAWNERLRALKNIPPVVRMVWESGPVVVALGSVLRVVAALVPLSMLAVTRWIIDAIVAHVSSQQSLPHHFWWWVALEFALASLGTILTRTVDYCDSLLADKFTRHISVRVMEHASHLDLASYEDPAFYDKLERARVQATDRLGMIQAIGRVMQQVITAGTLAAGILLYSPWLLVVLIACVVPAFLGESHFAFLGYSQNFRQTPVRRQLDYLRVLGASKESAKELKLFGLSAFLTGRYTELSDEIYRQNVSLAKRRLWAGSLLSLLSTAGYYGTYAFVIYQTVSGRLTVGTLTFRLEPGGRIALIGENGQGKTTIVKLLTRLYDPTEGAILLDGRDLREYDLEDLSGQTAVIFQDFMRYEMTAAENIAVGQIEARANRARIESAARKSLAEAVIRTLPSGYQQMLGRRFEGGVDLSGGEWQKMALARAYLRDAQLLILDEPTASLDARSEHAVFQRFAELTAGKMAVLISHRFSTVRMANRILVLEDGKIAEQGDHDDLIARGGRYSEMFELQAASYR